MVGAKEVLSRKSGVIVGDDGLKLFKHAQDYLAHQVGNPDGVDKPNKKYYDPRVWVREGEDHGRSCRRRSRRLQYR
jgi:hypothetical protein